jgi:hypothetical protein
MASSSSEPDVEQQDGLPLLPPLTALVELAVAFALIYGLDWLNPQLGILDMQPHPFWIPVLLLGLQYGTVSGLVAAGAAILASLFAGLPEAGIGENHFAYFLRVWGQPILWIAMALLVGQFRMRQIATKQELRRLGVQLARQRDDLAHHADGLRTRCEMLERELAARRGAAPHLAVARLAALERGSEPALTRQALGAVVDVVFPGGRARLYRLVDGALVEQAGDDEQAAGERRTIPRSHPLVMAVISGRASLSVLDASGERLLDGFGIVAVPVPLRDGSGACGMLALEQGAPDAVSAEGIAALEAIARVLSERIARTAATPAVVTPPLPQHESAERGGAPMRLGLRLLAGGDSAGALRDDAAGAASASATCVGDAVLER